VEKASPQTIEVRESTPRSDHNPKSVLNQIIFELFRLTIN